MSKISNYLDQLNRSADLYGQTVSELASELHMRPTDLIAQLRGIGVYAEHVDTQLTRLDVDAFRRHQQKVPEDTERARKRITFASRAERHHQAVCEEGNGAEWSALIEFSEAVLWGTPIDPKLQRLANLIFAKAVILGKLPPAPRGRPVADGTREFGERLAETFWDMRDKGVPYKDAIAKLGERYHKDERHLSRLIKEHSSWIGTTPEERERRRRWWNMVGTTIRSLRQDSSDAPTSIHPDEPPPPPELTEEDCLERLAELLHRDKNKGV